MRPHSHSSSRLDAERLINSVRYGQVGPPELMEWPEHGFRQGEHGFRLFSGPSDSGPWLLWQQPHPIVFAELSYREAPTAATLRRYNQSVHQTATFMADFVLAGRARDAASACLDLGPPVFTAEIESDEGKPATATRNPTFELTSWRSGPHMVHSHTGHFPSVHC